MFWRMGFAHTSPIDSLLDTDDFTLQQLLEEEDIIQGRFPSAGGREEG